MSQAEEMTKSARALVRIATFASATEADLAAGALRAAGIDASTRSDDCGGQEPQLQLIRGSHVFVRPEDAEDARAWLAECEAEDLARRATDGD